MEYVIFGAIYATSFAINYSYTRKYVSDPDWLDFIFTVTPFLNSAASPFLVWLALEEHYMKRGTSFVRRFFGIK